MPRSYSERFLLDLYNANQSQSLGVTLAKLCVEANIPATYIAVALEVSPTMVYKWFRGAGIRKKKQKVVEVFMDFLKKDMETGVLPAKTSIDARIYIQNLVGVKI